MHARELIKAADALFTTKSAPQGQPAGRPRQRPAGCPVFTKRAVGYAPTVPTPKDYSETVKGPPTQKREYITPGMPVTPMREPYAKSWSELSAEQNMTQPGQKGWSSKYPQTSNLYAGLQGGFGALMNTTANVYTSVPYAASSLGAKAGVVPEWVPEGLGDIKARYHDRTNRGLHQLVNWGRSRAWDTRPRPEDEGWEGAGERMIDAAAPLIAWTKAQPAMLAGHVAAGAYDAMAPNERQQAVAEVMGQLPPDVRPLADQQYSARMQELLSDGIPEEHAHNLALDYAHNATRRMLRSGGPQARHPLPNRLAGPQQPQPQPQPQQPQPQPQPSQRHTALPEAMQPQPQPQPQPQQPQAEPAPQPQPQQHAMLPETMRAQPQTAPMPQQPSQAEMQEVMGVKPPAGPAGSEGQEGAPGTTLDWLHTDDWESGEVYAEALGNVDKVDPEAVDQWAQQIKTGAIPEELMPAAVQQVLAYRLSDKARELAAEQGIPAEQALGKVVQQWAGDEFDAQDIARAADTAAEEAAEQANTDPNAVKQSPGFFDWFVDLWEGMDNNERIGLVIGVTGSVVALLNGLMGGDGMTTLLGAAAGLGGLGYAFGGRDWLSDKFGFGATPAAKAPAEPKTSKPGPEGWAETAAAGDAVAPAEAQEAAPTDIIPAADTQDEAPAEASPQGGQGIDLSGMMSDLRQEFGWLNDYGDAGGDPAKFDDPADIAKLLQAWRVRARMPRGIPSWAASALGPSDAQMRQIAGSLTREQKQQLLEQVQDAPALQNAGEADRQAVLGLLS